MNNLTIVTEPDVYVMDQPSFLTIGNSEDNLLICEFLRKMGKNITVYVGKKDSGLTWLLNSAASSDHILLNTSEINIQEIEDPIRFLIEWSLEQKEIA